MKLLVVNNKASGIFLKSVLKNSTEIETEKGIQKISEGTDVIIQDVQEEVLERVRKYVSDITSEEELSEYFYFSEGELKDTLNLRMIEIREERDRLLEESDKESKAIYTDLWNNLTEEEQTSWSNYRTELRDFPDTIDELLESVESYNWPTKPT